MMKKFIFSILSVFISVSIFAQSPSIIQGDLIVQTTANKTDIQKVINDFESIDLTFKKLLVPSMNIYLLSFDGNSISQEEALRNVGLHQNILVAQNNTTVELRATTPNDPEYQNQWQYDNDGSFGGVVDADIDAELAWDITTGGFTPNGDEIVICVVDDGAFLNHPDYGNNLWVNELETPNNGIDDDQNGFIDDYEGWDADNDNDAVNANFYSHGNAVAGIIGAQGDNGVGVAGVNWDVKLMIVEGGGGQAGALAAYSYPLEMRKLYNETNGSKGAFVVAVNSSWGIDFGQPSEAPLWCAMYDTMGKYGILNAGATINGNTNVDTDGDLPTGCSSDYLITVTNIGRNDFKVTEAGFGATTIDVGAFGQDTWTISDFDQTGYDSFGGTSGATPHVAGAVGLIYSAECTSFSNLYEEDPGQAALLAKQYIMDGGDPNPSLQGITVSGNRLNLFGTLNELIDNCINCPDIGNVIVSEFDSSSATLVFSPASAGSVSNYTIRYRIASTSTWSEINSSNNIVELENLLEGTIYEFQIQANCVDGDGKYSDSRFFETTDNSPSPNVSITSINETKHVSLYPNPAKDLLTIQFNEFQKNTTVEIFDLVGRLLYQNEINSDKKRLNIAGLNKGLYMIKISTENGDIFTEKFYKK